MIKKQIFNEKQKQINAKKAIWKHKMSFFTLN